MALSWKEKLGGFVAFIPFISTIPAIFKAVIYFRKAANQASDRRQVEATALKTKDIATLKLNIDVEEHQCFESLWKSSIAEIIPGLNIPAALYSAFVLSKLSKLRDVNNNAETQGEYLYEKYEIKKSDEGKELFEALKMFDYSNGNISVDQRKPLVALLQNELRKPNHGDSIESVKNVMNPLSESIKRISKVKEGVPKEQINSIREEIYNCNQSIKKLEEKEKLISKELEILKKIENYPQGWPEIASQYWENIKTLAASWERNESAEQQLERINQSNRIEEEYKTQKKEKYPALYEVEMRSENLSSKITIQNKKLKQLKADLDLAFLPTAQKLALNITTSEFKVNTDPLDDISTIRKFLAPLSKEKLKEYVIGHEKTIDSIVEQSKKQGGIAMSGRDALNMALLTRSDNPLKDKKVILAIFALEVLAKRSDIAAKNLILVDRELPLTDMLEWGFKTDLMQLESSTINNAPKEERGNIEEYVRRKSVNNTFLPVIESLHLARESVSPRKKDADWQLFTETKETKFDIKKFQSYRNKLNEIINVINNEKVKGKIDRLIENRAKADLAKLQREVKASFKELAVVVHYSPSESLDDFIKKLCSSTAFLDSSISHGFDRLHMIAALLDNKKYIETSDGKWSPREILEKAIDHMALNFNEENAIMIEQFYMRMNLVIKTYEEVYQTI